MKMKLGWGGGGEPRELLGYIPRFSTTTPINELLSSSATGLFHHCSFIIVPLISAYVSI